SLSGLSKSSYLRGQELLFIIVSTRLSKPSPLARNSLLSLANNELFGKLPASMTGNFTHLLYLNLSFNALSGEIPASLAQALELTSLFLSNNFSGNLLSGFGYLQ
ncbi:hypothetical protein AMTR_s00023p00063930, partial [Amborella trichopoda]